MHQCWKRAVGVLCCCGIMTGLSLTSYADSLDQIQLVEAKEFAGAEYSEPETESEESDTSGDVIQAVVYEQTAETTASEEAFTASEVQDETSLRQRVVSYALSFLGGPYCYGGSDPNTGVDCSGFTRYVMSNVAGIELSRSSKTQSNDGVSVSADQMQPGDLIFYAGSSGIDHVAMYIGAGKIVHASTYSTGIKISDWNYRTPVKIVSVLN